MKKIKEYRLRANLSQGQLAERLSVKQPSVSQWERGNAYPEVETARKLSEILQIPFGLIFDHYPQEGPLDIPVYSVIRGNGEEIPCTRAGSLLRVSQEELRMLIPRSEIADLCLSDGEHVWIDPEWFFGYYCESESMSPVILPNTVNLLYKTDKVIADAVYLVSLDGKDSILVRLVQNDRGLVILPGNDTSGHRFIRNNDIRSGSIRILGLVVETRKVFLH